MLLEEINRGGVVDSTHQVCRMLSCSVHMPCLRSVHAYRLHVVRRFESHLVNGPHMYF